MVIAAILGYLIGSIPAAQIVGRFYRVDPLGRGDGNPGWWNMRGLVGEKAALIVLAGDLSKGVLAAAVGSVLWGPWWTMYVSLGFAMVGHAFPLFAGFRGGRSVLTFVGGMFVVSFMAAIVAIVVGAIVGLATRRFVYGARTAMWALPFVQLFFLPRAYVACTGILMTFIGLRFLFARKNAPSTYEPAVVSPR